MRQFSRNEILIDLREKVAKRVPIIICGAGIGIIAKMADRAGVDFIMAYNTGPFRMDGSFAGAGYLAYGDSNAMTLELGRRILNFVEKTPVIGGIGAGDPYRNINQLIDEMLHIGFSGITNVPTAGVYQGWFRKGIDANGMGYPEEVNLIKNCNKRDIFTIAYSFNIEEIKAMVNAGADIISPHIGGTIGGTIGYPEDAVLSIEQACEQTQKMYEAALAENPDIVVVCHGGPFESPEKVQICFEKTDVHGFIGASSIERLPVEKAITEIVKAYKNLKLKKA